MWVRRSLAPVVVVALLAVGTLGSAAPARNTFGDDDGNIHEPNIELIAAAGITSGCNPPRNSEYCPGDPVTRGQMAAFLVRALDYTDNGGGNHFTDDDGDIFEDSIDKLATAGVTLGCNPPDNDRFCPGDPVTRGQMAAFLVRALDYTDNGGGNHFTDDDGNIFEDSIDKLATAGVTLGCNPPDNDLFCPGELVLRDQMASFLARALDLESTIPPGSTTTFPGETTTTSPRKPQCTGSIGAVTVDELVVPTGASCVLEGTVITGALSIESDASLTATDIEVGLNLQATGYAALDVTGATVGGKVSASGGGTSTLSDSSVTGPVTFDGNTGKVTAVTNEVGGALKALSNTGGVELTANVIGADLVCSDNDPPPVESANTVGGAKKDQCAEVP